MNDFKKFDETYLAIEILDRLGNREPTQLHIDIVESLIIIANKAQEITVHFPLTNTEIRRLYLWAIDKHSTEIGEMLSVKTKTIQAKCCIHGRSCF